MRKLQVENHGSLSYATLGVLDTDVTQADLLRVYRRLCLSYAQNNTSIHFNECGLFYPEGAKYRAVCMQIGSFCSHDVTKTENVLRN